MCGALRPENLPVGHLNKKELQLHMIFASGTLLISAFRHTALVFQQIQKSYGTDAISSKNTVRN